MASSKCLRKDFNALDSLPEDVAILRETFERSLDMLGEENIVPWIMMDVIPRLQMSMEVQWDNPLRQLSLTAYAFVLDERGYPELAKKMINLKYFFGIIAQRDFYVRAIKNTPPEKREEFMGILSKFVGKYVPEIY